MQSGVQLEQSVASPYTDGCHDSATWTTVRKWLESCNPRDHPSCHQSGTVSTNLPRRLLNITNINDMKLEETQAKQSPITYATLSHCWGTFQFLRLMKANKKQLMTKIEQSDLPKTFSDAIMIAKQIGVSYLWIDSLCICQDDSDDWRMESERMADVYGGSFCNIAATSAHNASEGCLLQKDRHLAGPCNVTTSNGDEYFVLLKNFWLREMATQPLLQRGWVVQERILAPRTLHFSRHQIFWECTQVVACEAYPERLPLHLLHYHDASLEWKHEMHKKREATFSWPSIVEAYSKCRLTYGSDKLPAIEGVARFCARDETRGRFIAGLWEKDLMSDLLWHIEDRSPSSGIRPEIYRAPSWSWASLDGPVRFFFFDRSLFELVRDKAKYLVTLNCEQYTGERDDTGHWYLRLECPIAPVYLRWTMQGTTKTYNVGIPHLTYTHDKVPKFKIYFDEKMRYITDLFFVPLMYNHDLGNYPASIDGLLLRPTGKSDGEYQRVGLVVMDNATDPLKQGSSLSTVFYSKLPEARLYEIIRSEYCTDLNMNLVYHTITVV